MQNNKDIETTINVIYRSLKGIWINDIKPEDRAKNKSFLLNYNILLEAVKKAYEYDKNGIFYYNSARERLVKFAEYKNRLFSDDIDSELKDYTLYAFIERIREFEGIAHKELDPLEFQKKASKNSKSSRSIEDK